MLDTLHRIVEEVNAAQDLSQALSIIVKRITQAMRVDVCSVFLTDHESQHHQLMATLGLNPDSVGKVRLGFAEGLVGLVGERAELINLEDASHHPRFRYFPETGEERYHAFLGVPIIHYRKTLGVLVVQQGAQRRFDDEEVAFLVTIASQLSGAIAHAEASGGIDGLNRQPSSQARYMQGLPGAAGVAIGIARVVYPLAQLDAVPDRETQDTEAEAAAFKRAVLAVQQEMRALEQRVGVALPVEERQLFDAYVRMVGSDSLMESTLKRIRAGNWAPGALRETISEHARIFEEMDDPYLRERAADIRDLGRRILMRLQENPCALRELSQRTVLVGEEISVSQLVEMSSEHLVGLVAARGSGFSHVAILARAMGIPAVMGLGDLPVGRLEGKEIIVDGYGGRVHIQPTRFLREEFDRLAREEAKLSLELEELREQPCKTLDGVVVPLYVNTGLLSDINSSLASVSDGIGLHRTEVPFMIRDRFPGEEEQRAVYHQVLKAFAPRPVTLRTLDVGGDKRLSYFPIEEDNPFLGWRGIRLTLDHPEIFLVQLRAMLRANAGLNNLQLLLPMISALGELEEALTLIDRTYNELIEEGEPVTRPRVGAMIEVPAAVYQIESLARRADFFSVGSNDLTQYLLAVDRNNARVAKLYEHLHPAVLRALVQIVEGAHRCGRPVSICGAMAGDPTAVILLLGMGIDNLSMNASSLLRVKWVIRSFSQHAARELLDQALHLEHPESIHRLLNDALEDVGLGALVRGGK
jgi:phosphoenolpyruvate-protein phosphotransferase